MNSKELAKELKTRAKLKSVSAAESILGDIIEIITQRLTVGENVTLARLGTFKSLPAKRLLENAQALEARTSTLPKPVIKFVPYCAFTSPDNRTAIDIEDEGDKYRLVRHLPKILECLDRYYAYQKTQSRKRKGEQNTFFEPNASDSQEQIEIKNLTRIILFWTDNPALPDMYVEQGFEWTQELDVLCRVACEFLAE